MAESAHLDPVAECVARSQIQNTFHRYAVLANETPDIAKMAALFHEDGTFRLPNGFVVKPRDLLDVVRGNNPDFIRHHITSIDMKFVSSSEAKTQSYFFAITRKSSFDHWGQWQDIVRKTADGRWLIFDRSVVVEGGDPNGWYKTTYPDK